jgi:hypothetical protein
MKKFSKITGQKVNESPKVVSEINEEAQFKSKIISLMDEFLAIRTYGPISRYYNAAQSKIAGKELLAEAIIDLLKEKDNSKETKILEELKKVSGDWKVIDDKIEELNSKKTLLSNRNKFNQMLENWSNTEDLLNFNREISVKIKSRKTLLDYIKLTESCNLDNVTKIDLINIYQSRLNQIGLSE